MQVIVPVLTAAEGDVPPAYSETEAASYSVDATVEIHPLPNSAQNHGVIVRVEPPKLPRDAKRSHVPCDIALVIDVSGSMSTDAPVPGETSDEPTDLSVLDLVKHSCRTILSTMDETDRLAIMTFSHKAKVLQPLLPMTPENKEKAEAHIERMGVESCTNLWAGIKSGIKLFENEDNTGRVPAVLVLTDGVPNHMCPPQGYVPALKALGTIVPAVHTFGFGYTLRSGLLKSIAEYGRGNYSFIPDAGMIGTVFVHAIAHLQSTFAIKASIHVTYPDHLELNQTAGPSVDQEQPTSCPNEHMHQITIPLGNIQCGQSRDIYLEWKSKSVDRNHTPYIKTTLLYNQMNATQYGRTAERSLLDISQALTMADIAYHISRHQICSFLANLFPIDAFGEHRMAMPSKMIGGPKITDDAVLAMKQAALKELIAGLPAARYPQDTRCAALLQDLTGPEPLGQVSLALSCAKYLLRWGQHYLPSLHGAHARQLCNTFKDPGPLQYGTTSPLFIACRDRLNAAFDELLVPQPSKTLPPFLRDPPYRGLGLFSGRAQSGEDTQNGVIMSSRRSGFGASLSMASYNSSRNPCFAARTPVRLAGGARVPIAALERGMHVDTPRGPRAVAAVLVTPVRAATMIRWKRVLVTAWHPVAGAAATGEEGVKERQWAFPCQLEQGKEVIYTGRIYSVLLERDGDVDAHAIMLGGARNGSFWGVTLGHGMLTGSDVRAHRFFGSYDSVVGSLLGLRLEEGGRFLGGGVQRSEKTGMVCGFMNGRSRLPPGLSSSAFKRLVYY